MGRVLFSGLILVFISVIRKRNCLQRIWVHSLFVFFFDGSALFIILVFGLSYVFFCLRPVSPMMRVSLDCTFLITPLTFTFNSSLCCSVYFYFLLVIIYWHEWLNFLDIYPTSCGSDYCFNYNIDQYLDQRTLEYIIKVKLWSANNPRIKYTNHFIDSV